MDRCLALACTVPSQGTLVSPSAYRVLKINPSKASKPCTGRQESGYPALYETRDGGRRENETGMEIRPDYRCPTSARFCQWERRRRGNLPDCRYPCRPGFGGRRKQALPATSRHLPRPPASGEFFFIFLLAASPVSSAAKQAAEKVGLYLAGIPGNMYSELLAAYCYSIATVQSKPNSSSLATYCAEQNRQFARAFALLEDAIRQQAFPGAVLAVAHRGNLVAHKAVGRFTYDPCSPVVEPHTIYDLASVSKVLATTAMAMLLFERGLLDLELPLVEVLPEFAGHDPRRATVTIRSLLAHSSGLPAYARLFVAAQGREAILRAACSLPLECDPGVHAEYSDIGFLLLGIALEKIASEPLDQFCGREIFTPLGMVRTRFRPPPEWRDKIPPTEHDLKFRMRLVQGEVQDENAASLGGVAGHAGLFAPALEVAVFAECMLRGGSPILQTRTVEWFTERQTTPPGTSRALGWDTPSRPSQSGSCFSSRSFGHLGYAGTSLWIDPDRRLSVTLLTNRTWPDRQSQLIKQVRPALHDAIWRALDAG